MTESLKLIKLGSSVDECEKHVQKIKRSLTLLKFFPIEKLKYNTLSEEEIEHIDQMIYRFMKLQDTIGQRLIPSIYYLLEPENMNVPFIDILNKLEKLTVIESAEKWQEYRELRNKLSHEYPEHEEQTVETLNLLFTMLPDFLKIYSNLKKYIISRNFIKIDFT